MSPARLISLFLLAAILLLPGCIKRTDRPGRIDFTTFFPLRQWDFYQYSGPLGKAVVTGHYNNLFTVTHYDSLENILMWRDYTRDDHSLGWKNVVYTAADKPTVHFEPALPFTPWSRTVGDTLLFSALQIRGDSANSHHHIQVEYKILSIEDVLTPAGRFNDCIRIRLSFKSLYNTVLRLPGDSHFWFARDIGLVKYIIPEGSGELRSARLGGRYFP